MSFRKIEKYERCIGSVYQIRLNASARAIVKSSAQLEVLLSGLRHSQWYVRRGYKNLSRSKRPHIRLCCNCNACNTYQLKHNIVGLHKICTFFQSSVIYLAIANLDSASRFRMSLVLGHTKVFLAKRGYCSVHKNNISMLNLGIEQKILTVGIQKKILDLLQLCVTTTHTGCIMMLFIPTCCYQ